MKFQLNPTLETLFLLAVGDLNEDEEDRIISELDELGVDGAEFYRRYFPIVVQYRKVFIENLACPIIDYFKLDDERILFSIYTYIFGQHPEWVNDMTDVRDDEVGSFILEILSEITGKNRALVDALDSLGISAETKWRILMLTQKPKEHIEKMAIVIRQNIPAFETARAAVGTELDLLLAEAEAYCTADAKNSRMLDISNKFAPDAEIVPTLALTVSVLLLKCDNKSLVIYGLLNRKFEQIITGESAFSKGELLSGAKALSDKSKVEILLQLKESPLYNLEIAQRVGLTAATVSHHMGMLCSCGFVEMEKRDGKVYYSIRKKEIERFSKGIAELLL